MVTAWLSADATGATTPATGAARFVTAAVLGAVATSVLLTPLVSGALADVTGAVTALTVLAAAEVVDASAEASGLSAAATGVGAVAAASASPVEA